MRLIRTMISLRLLRLANRLLTVAVAINPTLRDPGDRVRDAGLLPRR